MEFRVWPRVCDPRRAAFLVVIASSAVSATGLANGVVGRIELPPAENRPLTATKGFLDRAENPNKRVRLLDVGPYMLVVLESETKPAPPGQVVWELVGESFARPVIGVPTGSEVVIKNLSHTARTLVAAEDPKLIPGGPINPTGPKAFRVTEARVYTVGDKEAPHLSGKVVVVNTPYVANVEVTNGVGRFELAEVPEGTYKLRVFYKDGWVARPDETVNVPAKSKAKTEITVKIATLTAPTTKK